MQRIKIKNKFSNPEFLINKLHENPNLISLSIINMSRRLAPKIDIPQELYDYTNLECLEIVNYVLKGKIDITISNLNRLRFLNLSKNYLTGNIPESIRDLINLQTLNLQSNKLSGNIPESIGNLINLQTLNLQSNKLSGNIPESIGQLGSLENLNLGNNQLTGNIPPSIGNLRTLALLSLNSNNLSGDISNSLENLRNLAMLNLSNNPNLTGYIPLFLKGAMPNLENTQLTFNTTNISENNIRTYLFNKINNNRDVDNKLSNLQFTDASKLINAYIYSGNIDYLYTPRTQILLGNMLNPNANNKMKRDLGMEMVDKTVNQIYQANKKKYPEIDKILTSKHNKIYYVRAHGIVRLNEYFFVPDNLYIILTAGIGSKTYIKNMSLTHLDNIVNMRYLYNLMPGISYKAGSVASNQLRFFKPGDIINNVSLVFEDPKSNMGVSKFYNYHTYMKGGRLNQHIKNGSISWPEITENKVKTDLRYVVSKFIGKPGKYLLINGSCIAYYNVGYEPNIMNNTNNKAKAHSLIYSTHNEVDYASIIHRKLNCFHQLFSMDKSGAVSFVEDYSSTHKKTQNCYIEFMSKLRHKITELSKRKKKMRTNNAVALSSMMFQEANNNVQLKKLKDIYNYWRRVNIEVITFSAEKLADVLTLLDDITNIEEDRYYNDNAENKRKQRHYKFEVEHRNYN